MAKTNMKIVAVYLGFLVLCLVDNSYGAGEGQGDGNWFNRLGVGGAVGWTHNLGRTRVESASVVNGIVRIDAKQNDTVRPWVEVHSWWWESEDSEKARAKWGLGPFIAVAPGSNFVDAVGGGLMFGRKYKKDATSNLSFNLSVGGALELNAKVLGDGVNANQPLPAGETSARTKTLSVASLLIMFSVGWDAFEAGSQTKTPDTAPESKPTTSYEPPTDTATESVATTALSEKNPMIGPKKPI